jgi:hypothetical protein
MPKPSLSDADPRSLRIHPSSNIHRSQLLKEKLGRVRDVHLRDLRPILTRPTFKRVFLQVPISIQLAFVKQPYQC